VLGGCLVLVLPLHVVLGRRRRLVEGMATGRIK